jgi:tetratricopeptide (TPR) repeat protein
MAVSWPGQLTHADRASNDADVAVAEVLAEGLPEDTAEIPPGVRPRRRKVLTSGWDDATFGVLERYAHKEFRGDRSAAVRFLVRQGLRAQGYFGPQPSCDPDAAVMAAPEAEPASPFSELAREGLEARLADLERVAETVEYATWLRKRARIELERMASSLEDDLLRAAAQSAVDRLSPLEPAPEAPEPIEIEAPPPAAPPPPPPSDVRPVLREAFAASAGGDYRQAIALFDQVLASDDAHRTARLGRAVALRRAGKPQEALADLEVVLRAEPRNAAALLARGQILQARGDLDAALSSFDLLVEVAANDWDVWMARGDVLAKMGRNEDALRSYGEALRRNPDDQGLQARIRTLEIAHPSAAPMTLPRPPTPRGIEEGQSYLVREVRRERSLSAFRALAGQKIPSLVLTGRPRDQVRREVGVGSARILGLSYTPGEDLHNPTALASLTRTIERFVEDNQGHGVILLDGLDDLVAGNGFRDTLLFVEHVNEAILQSHAILLVSVAPDALPEREAALLERSLRVLE